MSPVGKQRSHESAVAHVSGTAVYTDDQREPAGMLSLYPVLSPHARATITKLDVVPALTVAGCVTVLTAADVPGENNTGAIVHDEVLLPTDEVSYYGQVVAWAVGETEAAAREGAAKIVVEYEPLPAIKTVKEAIAANFYHNTPQFIRRGDPDAVLAQSEHRFTGEVEIGGQDHFYLETQTSWALPDGEGNLQLYTSTQHPTETQEIIARILGLSKNRVVCTCIRMGGGFGGKESQANPFASAAALATYKTGRPARCRLRRHHDMLITGKRHGFLGQYEVGFNSDGTITAMKAVLTADGGWSLDLSSPVLGRAMLHIDNAYYVPNLVVEGRIAKTNRVSNTAYRGFGGPQGMIVIEEVVDRIARTLNLPPDLVRERNFYHGDGETNRTHYDQDIVDNRIARVWQEAKANANYGARQTEITAFNNTSPYKKRGLAITPVKFGISFNNVMYNQAGALVLIYTDGSIQLNHGGTEMGQGLHTKMMQVAANALGVKIDRLRLMPTSTDKVPNTSATAASSGSDLNGQAMKNACEILRDRLAAVAVRMLNLDAPEDMVFADDWIYCRTYPSARIAFEEVVKQAYSERISLSTTGFYRTPNIFWDPKLGKGRPFYYFAYGAAVCEVEVDGFTGTFKLRQVDIVHDVGESLNPLVDKGQVEGAFVQGMGWLTMEELVWDGEGRLRTFAPSTYKIPTISEVPERFTVHLLERAAQDGVIYGSKAVGEPPFMLAIAVREAIRAAVAAFGNANYVPLALPATPEATLWAIEAVKAAVGKGQPVEVVS
ncbi:MAG: xanthine dehydrogenase molybdopterin binding subunit [Tildeniella torsiva UHER 1998/13D]|jgi:xanthine dehydrogenase large subunit|nr:xanthine dehydrogenase molybdopterin binding subunit [Tildeniella torsiva UHER 1998/13D]